MAEPGGLQQPMSMLIEDSRTEAAEPESDGAAAVFDCNVLHRVKKRCHHRVRLLSDDRD